jgi:hypothetical protein
MAAENKYPIAVIIEAIDKITGPMRSIQQRIDKTIAPVRGLTAGFRGLGFEGGGKLTGKLNMLGRNFRELGDWTALLGQEAGIPKVAAGIGGLGKAAGGVVGALQATAVTLAGIGVAGYGIQALVTSFAEFGDHIKKTSHLLGITTTGYQELSFAAKRAEITQDEFDRNMQRLSSTMVDVARGTGKAVPVFKALGLSVKDSEGKVKNLETFLPELADKLKGVTNANVRAAIVQEIFGDKAAAMSVMLEKGSAGLKDMAAEAHRLGVVLDGDGIEKAEAFKNTMEKLQSIFIGLRNTLGVALAPALQKLGETLEKTILQNKDAIKAFAEGLAEQLPGIINAVVVGLGALLAIGSACAKVFVFLSDIFGTTNVTLALFAATIGKGLTVAIWGLTKAFIQLGIAMLTTPIGWIILGIVALGAAGYLLIKNWDKVKQWFSGFFTWMAEKWQALVENFGKVGEFFGFGGGGEGPAAAGSQQPNAAQLGAEALGQRLAQQNSSVTNNAEVTVKFANSPEGTRVRGSADEGMGLNLYNGPLLMGQ